MGLLLAHPEVAYRSCDECQKWYFDPQTGRQEKRRRKDPADGKLKLLPVARKPGALPPCWKCPKCSGDAKTPEEGRKAELSEKNWKALRFYYEQKAVGGPVDAVARRNCGIIERVLEEHRTATGRAMIDLTKAKL